MPEGDTAHLAARRLDRALHGEVLREAAMRVPRYASCELAGRKVFEV